MKIAHNTRGWVLGALVGLSPFLLATSNILLGEVRGLPPVTSSTTGGASPLPTPTPTPTPTDGPPTETFYVSATGDGTLPETAVAATAWDEADFNTAGNWAVVDADDGKIGPGDTVILIDTAGDLEGLAPQGSGTAAKPITITRRSSSTAPVVDGDAGAGTSNALLIDGVGYLVFEGITFKGGDGATEGSVYITGAGSDSIIIRECVIGPSTQHGVLLSATAGANIEIAESEITTNSLDGISSAAHVGSTDAATATLITDNSVHDNLQDGIKVNGNFWIVDGNTVADNGSAGAFMGIHVYGGATDEGTGDDNIIRYNSVTGQVGNDNDGGGITIDRFSSDNQVYYNLSYANAGPGISANDAPGTILYNNVSYGNLTAGLATEKAEIRLASTATDSTTAIVKNNIAFATAADTYAIYIDAEVSNNTLDITTNDWYRASGNWYFFNATPGATLATWNALVAGIGTDLNEDPPFDDAPAADFHIDAESNLIDVGTDVGLSLDFGGAIISGSPEIGAYEEFASVGDELVFQGGGSISLGHTAIIGSLGFDTCTVVFNDANSSSAGGVGSSDEGGNPTGGANTCNTAGGSCEGTFRQCVDPSTARSRPRLVNFSVGGRISVHACVPGGAGCPGGTAEEIQLEQPYLTIDGFTAPDPGITIRQFNYGRDANNGGVGRPLLLVKRNHDLIIRGLRFQGHFIPNVEDTGDEVQVVMFDGDTGNKFCSSWDPDPECPSCTIGVCGECGGAGEPLCYGNRKIILDHNTFTAGNDENGAFWKGAQNITRQYNFWYSNFHPAGLASNSYYTQDDTRTKRYFSDIGNLSWANGERTPQIRQGTFDFDLINNTIGDWRNYTGIAGGGSGGYGFHHADPPNIRNNGIGNFFSPGRNGSAPPAPRWRPDWDCFEAGNPGANVNSTCVPGSPNFAWCKLHWSLNLFSDQHDPEHCTPRPTGQVQYTRTYPMPTVLNPMDAADYTAFEALINGAGMPYPNAEELAAKAEAIAAYQARRAECAANPSGNGCQQ